MSREITDITDKPAPDLIWNYDRETGSGPLHISDKNCKVGRDSRELTRCGRAMYPDFHSWHLELKGRSVTERRLCKRCGSPEDFESALEQRRVWNAERRAKEKVAAEAAEAERQRAREAQHNRLMELHAQILRRVRDAYAVKATDYSTFEFLGHRYEIREIS